MCNRYLKRKGRYHNGQISCTTNYWWIRRRWCTCCARVWLYPLSSTINRSQRHPSSRTLDVRRREGPANWGKLDPAYTLCSDGSAQTPIDIVNPVKKDIVDPVFGYQKGAVGIVNNGHTIQAVAAAGNTITLDGQVFTLAQMHFHAPSEHAINGKKSAIEAHFVHKNSAGKLAVVGVMIDEGSSDNAAWEPFVQSLTTVKGTDGTATLDWGQLLPTSTLTYQYTGSLTTPPCSEGVHWVLMQTPVQLSARQIAAFTAAYNGNDRPIQPVGNREVDVDVSGN